MGALISVFTMMGASPARAASGTEGASFLDIPVGARPAAMASAYTAQATDSYAPVWNPAGLGRLESVELTGTHLNYLESVHYENVSFVVPMGKGEEPGTQKSGLGFAVQYLGTGNIDSFTDQNIPAGTFSSTFAAYSVAYGLRVADRWSLGATGKAISEKISDASASAYAADLGAMYQPNRQWMIGAAAVNLGTPIKFVSESDPLPMAARVGALYKFLPEMDLALETVYRKTGLFSGSLGLEYRYGQYLAVRGGFDSSRMKELGGGTGFTAGVGVFALGQEFSFAWVPMADLGTTYYFSLVLRFTTQPRPNQPKLTPAEKPEAGLQPAKEKGPEEYQNLQDMLSDDEKKSLQKNH